MIKHLQKNAFHVYFFRKTGKLAILECCIVIVLSIFVVTKSHVVLEPHLVTVSCTVTKVHMVAKFYIVGRRVIYILYIPMLGEPNCRFYKIGSIVANL